MTFFQIALSFFFISEIWAGPLLRPWDRSSHPGIMLTDFKNEFSTLPLSGEVGETKKYWSSDYWPLFKGNINYRWNSPSPIGFNLDSPDKETARRMSLPELAQLSPSEKYDLFTGRYDYPLKRQVERKVSPYISEWQGICHGWAAAALNHNEPVPKVLINPDGIKIPFGSSDIKALLSYFYAYLYDPISTYQTGLRCNGRRYCKDDMNAGAFHLILTNKVGLQKRGFIADIDNGTEVWNQVVYNYQTKIIDTDLPPSRDSAWGTVKVVRVNTLMRVVFNIVRNSWSPVIGTPLQTFKDVEYEYDLDLNVNGKILGGDWISEARPDFLWTVDGAKNFTGILSRMGELLPVKRARRHSGP